MTLRNVLTLVESAEQYAEAKVTFECILKDGWAYEVEVKAPTKLDFDAVTKTDLIRVLKKARPRDIISDTFADLERKDEVAEAAFYLIVKKNGGKRAARLFTINVDDPIVGLLFDKFGHKR